MAIDEKIYPTYKIARLASVLHDQGLLADDLLSDTGITAAELSSHSARISRRQVIAAYRNAVGLSRDTAIGLTAGQRLGLTDYGIYGYALISSATLRKALTFAIEYHPMATPTVHMSLEIDDEAGTAAFLMQDLLNVPDLRVFNIDLQLSLVFSLFKEMAGETFRFSKIEASFPAPPHHQSYARLFGCDVLFDQPQNALVFDTSWLDQPLTRANPITEATVRELCDRFLLQMHTESGIAHSVYTMIMKDPRTFNTIEIVADKLRLSPRTLRRKLALQGTTFRQLHNDIRMQLAIEFLRSSNMSTDDVADRLGFSDAANFRHAFKKWTKRTTGEYRRLARVSQQA
jgi:AraC-like DNA-binding protein